MTEEHKKWLEQRAEETFYAFDVDLDVASFMNAFQQALKQQNRSLEDFGKIMLALTMCLGEKETLKVGVSDFWQTVDEFAIERRGSSHEN